MSDNKFTLSAIGVFLLGVAIITALSFAFLRDADARKVGPPLDAASVSRHGNGWVSFELTLRGETRRYLWHPTEPFLEVEAGEGGREGE